VGRGDEVIVPANTFVATTLAIVRTGARPVLVDCDPETYNIDPAQIEARLTSRTRVILPVHLYGRPAAMDEINSLARKYRLQVVEDACQAHGALYRDRRCGSLGRAGCFSFYPGKNLGAYGDGGGVVTDSLKTAEKIRVLRNYGSRKKYYHREKGFNSRLDTIQAAVLNVKLRHLEEWNRRRRVAAALYTELLRDIPGLVLPAAAPGLTPVFHLYVIRVRRRNRVLRELRSRGIGAGIHYPIPLHLLRCHRDLGYRKGDFPVTEKLSREILSLPLFPEITSAQVNYVASALKAAWKRI
jgi:dTDP-4-amino-4,6-dideoxygalactose transaminase